MRIKICGITHPDQAQAIAALGVSTLGFIGVTRSPRYIAPKAIQEILATLPSMVKTIGVVVNEPTAELVDWVNQTGLTGLQLHGEESPQQCQQLRKQLPHIELIKAFRIRQPADLAQIQRYAATVDAFLLDAYVPQAHGGTGQTLDWHSLQDFSPTKPWFLAGGIRPENVLEALQQVNPDGLDVSSGVERSPSDKDIQKVQALLSQIKATS